MLERGQPQIGHAALLEVLREAREELGRGATTDISPQVWLKQFEERSVCS